MTGKCALKGAWLDPTVQPLRDWARRTRPGGSEERLQALIQLSSDWYWETDTAHRFRGVVQSPRYRSGLEDDPLGKGWWELQGFDAPIRVGCGSGRCCSVRSPFTNSK